MLFNSLEYAVFLPLVFIIHWLLCKNWRAQNLFLLLASYTFYSFWDWRFTFLLLFSTLLDYYSGIKIHEAAGISRKRFWLWLSIIINLGFLGVFKYYNFFVDSLVEVGLGSHFSALQIILPVGISFYTFHGLSYVIDIYYKRIEPEYNFDTYAMFVSFFPLLVAGPIERATHLLPQIKSKREFSYLKATDGLRQMLWGLFKKVVIADNCAKFADEIFNHHASYPGSTLLLGAIFFTIQIYCDFSGYSDIALGTAKLFGIDLLRNFAFPYFSRDIAEFWRRWHISLSSWFKDYVYIPLGGSKGGKLQQLRNTFIIFTLSGFWHGANWTYVIWGVLNALYFVPLLLTNRNRRNTDSIAAGRMIPSVKEFLAMTSTMGMVTLGWIFFRAQSLGQAVDILSEIFSRSLLSVPTFKGFKDMIVIAPIVAGFFAIEWIGRENKYAIEHLGFHWARPVRWAFYSMIIFVIGMYMQTGETPFIYFQF